MTNPRLTDEAVGRLPLSRARAELLEDIMAAAPIESVTDAPVRRPRRRGMLIAVGTAAATVAALFAVPALLNSADSDSVAGQPTAATGEHLVLDAPGWEIAYTTDGEGAFEVQYANGSQRVDLHRRPASAYDDYYDDRAHIVSQVEPLENDLSPSAVTTEPTPNPTETAVPDNDITPTAAPGKPVTLLGQPGEMWAYAPTEHTTIGVVQDGWYPEVRGSGMDRATYLELLTHVRTVSGAEFKAALPDTFVTEGQQDVVLEMMADMPGPPTWEYVRPDGPSRYQLGVSAAGSVACAWLDEWTDATTKNDKRRVKRAVDALGTSRDWAVLHEMNAEGDYPEVLWGYADEVAAGRVPQGYREGLGCP